MRNSMMNSLGVVGAALLGLAACVASGNLRTDPLEGTSWQLVAIEGQSPVADAGASFDGEIVGGSTGCNDYGASYQVDGNQIEIGEIALTEMACIEPEGAMDQERRFVELLSAVDGYRLEDESLRLLRADREVLIFELQG